MLGLWIGRDKSRPVTFALAMTMLVTSAVGVGCFQSYLDSVDNIKKENNLIDWDRVCGTCFVAGDRQAGTAVGISGTVIPETLRWARCTTTSAPRARCTGPAWTTCMGG